MDINRDVAPSPRFKGGESEAGKRLKKFLNQKLEKYPKLSNDPAKEGTSNLSPYLHFGHISPVEISLKVKKSDASEDAKSEFLEQLIVRRELAVNFAYDSNYSTFDSIDGWAKETLEKHRKDERKHIYSEEELENAETHDRFWNAAQNEMRKTGKMHNYMRMYWGKRFSNGRRIPRKPTKSL